MKDYTTLHVSRNSLVYNSRLGETNRLLVATSLNRFSDPCIRLKSSPPPPLNQSIPALSPALTVFHQKYAPPNRILRYCRGACLPSSLCWSLDTVRYSWQADTVGRKYSISGVVNLYGRTVLLLCHTPCIPVIELFLACYDTE